VLDFHRQNPNMGPQSLLGKHKRRAMTDYDKELAQQFGRLSPEESKRMMPIMESLEAKRKQVEEEELARREKLNKQLGTGERTLEGFIHAASRGSLSGMAMSGMGMLGGIPGMIGGSALAAVLAAAGNFQREVKEGGRALSPGGAQTEDVSEKLRKMAEGNQQGELLRQREAAKRSQFEAQAYNLGMNPLAASLNPFQGWGTYAVELARTGKTGAASAAREKFIGEQFANIVREKGGEPKFREDIFNPIESRITTGEGFEQSLANAAMQSSGQQASNEVLRQQLEKSNMLLRELVTISRGNSGPAFGD
jgi:hypothetical protein